MAGWAMAAGWASERRSERMARTQALRARDATCQNWVADHPRTPRACSPRPPGRPATATRGRCSRRASARPSRRAVPQDVLRPLRADVPARAQVLSCGRVMRRPSSAPGDQVACRPHHLVRCGLQRRRLSPRPGRACVHVSRPRSHFQWPGNLAPSARLLRCGSELFGQALGACTRGEDGAFV